MNTIYDVTRSVRRHHLNQNGIYEPILDLKCVSAQNSPGRVYSMAVGSPAIMKVTPAGTSVVAVHSKLRIKYLGCELLDCSL